MIEPSTTEDDDYRNNQSLYAFTRFFSIGVSILISIIFSRYLLLCNEEQIAQWESL